MRKKIVAGNWKMNLDFTEGLSLLSEIVHMVKDEVHNDVSIVIASPFIHLQRLVQLAKDNPKISIGAQNCHHQPSGAFTGEISALMLQSIGCQYVIIGHSERRQYFLEDNQLLAQKISVALKNNLIPIYCVGETLQHREQNQYCAIIEEQLKQGIFQLPEAEFSKIIIAYEPVWAIGTGKTANPEQAQEIHAFIREKIAQRYNINIAQQTSILYGGSCNIANAKQLFAQKDIDGGLIGGASLKSRDFLDIIKSF